LLIQNEKSFSKIKEKINVAKYKSIQKIFKKMFNYNFLSPDLIQVISLHDINDSKCTTKLKVFAPHLNNT